MLARLLSKHFEKLWDEGAVKVSNEDLFTCLLAAVQMQIITGAFLAAALPGIQAQGVALQKISKIKFLILISGAKFGGMNYGTPKLASNAFSKPIDCPSLHIIGDMDFLKPESIILREAFVDPVVIHHPKGHTIPRLDEKSLPTMLGFIDTIQKGCYQIIGARIES